jgi:hypothetical protein
MTGSREGKETHAKDGQVLRDLRAWGPYDQALATLATLTDDSMDSDEAYQRDFGIVLVLSLMPFGST